MLTTDQQVRRLRRLDAQGTPLAVAAARSGMDAKTARKYRRLGRLPSEVRMPHAWRTHPDPFADVWAGVAERLTLFLIDQFERGYSSGRAAGEAVERYHDGDFERRA